MEQFLSYRVNSNHPNLFPSRIKRDQTDVSTVQEVITKMFVNPFEEVELISLSSGVLPPENVPFGLLEAHTKGENEMEKFINERLVEQKVGFYEPFKRLKLGTFTKMMKRSYNSVHKVKSSGKLLSSNRRESLISMKYFATHLGQFHGLWEQAQEN